MPPRGCLMNATQQQHEHSDVNHAASLNFKVSPEFKKDFKGFAVANNMSMTELLKEGFLLSKQKRGA
jgi:hypothetical protein